MGKGNTFFQMNEQQKTTGKLLKDLSELIEKVKGKRQLFDDKMSENKMYVEYIRNLNRNLKQ